MMKEYITKEDALNALCEASTPTFSLTGEPILDVDYVPAINAIPVSDVRPVVRGRWITPPKNRDYAHMLDFYECPLCGYIEDCSVNFCPNCGAEMSNE